MMIYTMVRSFLCIGMMLTSSCAFSQEWTSRAQELTAHNLVDNNGVPQPALLQLLATTGVEHDGTLAGITLATQIAWLRLPGQERWQMPHYTADNKELLVELLTQMGMKDALYPTHMHYDYGVVLGALTERVRMRLAFLIEQWNAGIRFDTLLFLGGQRPLDASVESERELLEGTAPGWRRKAGWTLQGALPTTEIDMIRMVIDQTELPADMAALPRLFIDAPMKQAADGSLTRPTRADTIFAWLEQNPLPGSGLFSSSQPHALYENAVIALYLPKEFKHETIGGAASSATNVAVMLDAVARTLYCLNISSQEMRE